MLGYTLQSLLPHLSCASWLYTQSSPDRASSLVSLDRLRHYQRVFVAHLDGIVASESMILEESLAELNRWKGPGELFASLYLVLETSDSDSFDAVYQFLRDHTSQHFIDAAAYVFLWLSPDKTVTVLNQWFTSEDTLLHQIALNAQGLRRELYPFALELLFTHESPGLRAEAYRYAGRLRRFDAIPHLHRALTDPEPDVREQASIALILCNQPHSALSGIYDAIKYHAACADTGEGAASIRSERRAQHLARLFGHAIPFPCTQDAADSLCSELPTYLAILVLAHHGNPALIPQLIRFMSNDTDPIAQGLYKRRALWAMSFILGINPETEGLLSNIPSLSADWPRAPGLDQDTGLPEADACKVWTWWSANSVRYLGATVPLLSGHEMTSLTVARTLLESGMQAQRFAAALHACRLSDSTPWIDTRAPIAMQRRLWELIQD